MRNIPQDIYRALIKHMGDNNLEPYDDLIIDNEAHLYDAYINKTHYRAFYTAGLWPFRGMPLYLICWYGLINSEKNYMFYSII